MDAFLNHPTSGRLLVDVEDVLVWQGPPVGVHVYMHVLLVHVGLKQSFMIGFWGPLNVVHLCGQ